MNLYHYSNSNSIESILTSKKMRATASTQSNDTLDTVYLATLLEEGLIRWMRNNPCIDNEKAKELMVNMLKDIFNEACDERVKLFSTKAKNDKCFVLCFTEKRDSRFLWATYTKNEGGCFVVDKNEFETYLKSIQRRNFLYYKFDKVIYDKEKQYSKIKNILIDNWDKHYKDTEKLIDKTTVIAPTIQFVDDDSNVISEHEMSPMAFTPRVWYLNFLRNVVDDFLEIAPFIKHKYWEEEKEWRLVFYRPYYDERLEKLGFYTFPQVENNQDKSWKRPGSYYIEFYFAPTLIKEFIMAPRSNVNIETVKNYIVGDKVLQSTGQGVLRY